MTKATFDLGVTPLSIAEAAGLWLTRFHRGIAVTIDAKAITLECDFYDRPHLERAWRAALLNERLLQAAFRQRRATLANLVQ